MIEYKKLISVRSPSEEFNAHLKINDNYRIIFSGKFGIGKTFFLKHFFETHKEDYNAIFLSPVNYVISSNEDIFELIKVDIIRELFFSGKLLAKKTTRKTREKIDLFINEKPHHLFKFLTAAFKSVNPYFKVTDDFFVAFAELYKKYKKYEGDLQKELQTNEEHLFDFVNSFSDIKGSIFENDFITRTIDATLKNIKVGKKNILIIDDLDRIDPEHIFRILNIFSAHNNYYDTQNKFDFDHIIIVCDIENIKKIFYHRYGSEVDFDGYIDKFFSTELFIFSNNDAIVEYVKEEFNVDEKDNYYKFLIFFLSELVNNDLITLRKLLKHRYKISAKQFVLFERRFQVEGRWASGYPNWIDANTLMIQSKDLKILSLFRFFNSLFGEFSSFIKVLEEVTKTEKIGQLKDYKEILEFVGLQLQLCKTQSLEVFVLIHHSRSQTFVDGWNWPSVKVLSQNVHFEPQWTDENKYTNQKSFFENVKVYMEHLNDSDKQKQVRISEIFKVIRMIVDNCSKYNYLQKAGISYALKK